MLFFIPLFLIGVNSVAVRKPEKEQKEKVLLVPKDKVDEISRKSQKKFLGKPLNTMTPKPSFTRFVMLANQIQDGADLPLPFPKDEDSSDSLKEEIKRQLVSTPMIVFYSVLAACVIIACGLFMFCSENQSEEEKIMEEIQIAALEEQLNETLDPQLKNEAPLQI